MAWYDELYDALVGGSDTSSLDTPSSFNPTQGYEAGVAAANDAASSGGGIPFYLRPGFLQGAGSAIGGLSQAYAGSRASDAQVNAANLAIEAQRRARDEDIARLQPRLTAGNNALAQMQSGAFAQPAPFVYNPNKYTASPGYDFRRNQGLLALDRTAAANAGLQSGAALKAAARFGGDLAAQDYREFDARDYARALDAYNSNVAQSNTGYNRLAGLADIGQTAGTQIGTAGQNYATNFGNLTGQAGQAIGAGYLGAGNSVNNLFGALNQQYNTNQMMDILNQSRRSAYNPNA